MYEVKAKSMFSAAHHLLNYDGKCENQHGHNFNVEVSVRGYNLDKSNILVDFRILKYELNKILGLLDHNDLNELDYFKNESPSSEMIAKFIFDNLSKTFDELYYTAVWESEASCAYYYGENK